jgi:hypothetical protein
MATLQIANKFLVTGLVSAQDFCPDLAQGAQSTVMRMAKIIIMTNRNHRPSRSHRS